MSVSYTLFHPIVGMFNDEHTITTLPVGAVVEAPAAIPVVGIVEVRYEARLMKVFASDLMESAERDSTPQA